MKVARKWRKKVVDMATLRSSLPSRLRQLLSGEAAIGGPSIKLDSDTVSSIYTPNFVYVCLCMCCVFLFFFRGKGAVFIDGFLDW